MNLLYRTTFPLNPPAACRDNQCLSEGMRVPGGACARLKSDAGTGYERRVGRLKWRVNPYRTGKPVGWTFAGRLRADAFDLHNRIPLGQ